MFTPSDISGAIISVIVIGGLLALGLLMRSGRCKSLVAGYNTLSPKEREKVDAYALTRFTGGLVLVIDACMTLTLIAAILDWVWLVLVGIALVFVVAVGGIIYANRKHRFYKK